MNAYPLSACKGDSCRQGKAPCTTEAICTTALHRFTPRLRADDVTDSEYKAEITMEPTTFDKVMYALSLAFFGLSVALVAGLAGFFWINREILLGLML